MSDLSAEVGEQEGVGAEVVEEMGIHRDLVQVEHPGQLLGEDGLDGRRGLCVGLPRVRASSALRRGQPLPVDLAAGHRREDGQLLQVGGHHVRGKAFTQAQVDLPQIQRPSAGSRADVGHQLDQPGVRLPGGHGGLRDAGQSQQHRFDLGQLDAVAADLHLGVDAPQVGQALGVGAHHVTGVVGALPTHAPQGAEPGCVLVRVEVTGRADAGDDQLARLAPRHGLAAERVDDGQLPTVERKPDADGAVDGQRRGARDDGGLGGAVGVPHLGADGGQASGQLGRARLAAEDQQPDAAQLLGRPQRGQCRHGRHHGDPPRHQPAAELGAHLHQRPWGGHEARAVPPGQPHLLAGSVEGHREAREHPVVRSERRRPQEQACFGVHPSRRAAVGDGNAFGFAGRPGGEDDPRVVGRARPSRSGSARCDRAQADAVAVAEHRADACLGPHGLGALVRIVDVDRYVGRSDGQDREDGAVQLGRARGHANADPVTSADADGREAVAQRVQPTDQGGVGQHLVAVVDRRGIGEPRRRGLEDLQQRAWRRRRSARIHRERRPHRGLRPGNGERGRRVHHSPFIRCTASRRSQAVKPNRERIS